MKREDDKNDIFLRYIIYEQPITFSFRVGFVLTK